MPDSASVAVAVTVKEPAAADGRYQTVPPLSYARGRPENAREGAAGAVVSTLATADAGDVPWLPTRSVRSSR